MQRRRATGCAAPVQRLERRRSYFLDPSSLFPLFEIETFERLPQGRRAGKSRQCQSPSMIEDTQAHPYYRKGARIELFGIRLGIAARLSITTDGRETRVGLAFCLPDFQHHGIERCIEMSQGLLLQRLGPNHDLILARAYIYHRVQVPMLSRRIIVHGLSSKGAYNITRLCDQQPVQFRWAAERRKIAIFVAISRPTDRYRLSPEWSVFTGSLRRVYGPYLSASLRVSVAMTDCVQPGTMSNGSLTRTAICRFAGWSTFKQCAWVTVSVRRCRLLCPSIDYQMAAFLRSDSWRKITSFSCEQRSDTCGPLGQDTQRAFAAAKWEAENRLTGIGQEILLNRICCVAISIIQHGNNALNDYTRICWSWGLAKTRDRSHCSRSALAFHR
jgi:hypothetical protein